MKKFYLYFLMMFSSAGAFAKATTESNVIAVYPHYGSASYYNSFAHSRLVAKSHYVYINGALVPADSVKYSYISNARGGSPALMDDIDDNVFFDSSYTTIYPDNVTPLPRMQRLQTYQANNRVATLTMRPWRSSYASYRDSVRFNYYYDANTGCNDYMLLDIAFGTGWNNTVGYTNTYSGTKLTSTTSVAFGGMNIQYDYDANNNLIFTSTSYELDSFFYDNLNRVSSRYIQKPVNAGASWVDSERWNYTYIGSTNDVDYSYREIYTGNSWVPSEKHLFSYDANHNRLSEITLAWNNNSYTNAKKLEWIYNSYNQPTQLTCNTWDGSGWVFATNDYQRHFYYEYFVPTGIHNADIDALSLNIYPVPASGNINIETNWKTPQSFTVSVCDMTGRTLRTYHKDATNYVVENIPVTDLPPGSYFVRINGDKGGIATKKFVVIH